MRELEEKKAITVEVEVSISPALKLRGRGGLDDWPLILKSIREHIGELREVVAELGGIAPTPPALPVAVPKVEAPEMTRVICEELGISVEDLLKCIEFRSDCPVIKKHPIPAFTKAIRILLYLMKRCYDKEDVETLKRSLVNSGILLKSKEPSKSIHYLGKEGLLEKRGEKVILTGKGYSQAEKDLVEFCGAVKA